MKKMRHLLLEATKFWAFLAKVSHGNKRNEETKRETSVSLPVSSFVELSTTFVVETNPVFKKPVSVTHV